MLKVKKFLGGGRTARRDNNNNATDGGAAGGLGPALADGRGGGHRHHQQQHGGGGGRGEQQHRPQPPQQQQMRGGGGCWQPQSSSSRATTAAVAIHVPPGREEEEQNFQKFWRGGRGEQRRQPQPQQQQRQRTEEAGRGGFRQPQPSTSRTTTTTAVHAPPPPAPPRLADYAPLLPIGRGMFSKVWSGVDRRGGGEEEVAIKQVKLTGLDPKTLELMHSELHLLASLRHPNVVCLHAAFLEETWGRNGAGHPTKVANLISIMELVTGGDLDKFIQANAQPPVHFDESLVWHIASRVASAVAYIHSKDVLHRDLKPANVLLSDDLRTVKLADFGLSRYASRYDQVRTFTGTMYYMAPERVAQAVYGKAADVWSLGCLIYECAALRSPFSEETSDIERLAQMIFRAEYPQLPKSYSPRLRSTVRHCLTADMAKRPTAAAIHRWSAEMDSSLKWEESQLAAAYWASLIDSRASSAA